MSFFDDNDGGRRQRRFNRKAQARIRALEAELAALKRENAELAMVARRAIAAYYAPFTTHPGLVQHLSERLASITEASDARV